MAEGKWPALIEILCDEITRKAPFTLKRVKWKCYSEEQSRIHIGHGAPTELIVAA